MNEERLRQALLDEPVPEAREAEERGWRVVRSAFDPAPDRARPPRRRRRALELALATGLVAVMISPAGAAVREWVGDTLRSEQAPSRPALTSLPGGGSLLVDSAAGSWLVRHDGSKRLLGPYPEATWSAHGLFVAATTTHQLLAVDPAGNVRWSLARGGPVRDPAWSPDGYRIAYLDGSRLRVVAADGIGDRVMATNAAPVAPAWAPGPRHVLSFVDASGRLRTIDVDRRRTLSRFAAPAGATGLAWSRDGARLLVLAPSELQVHSRGGRLLWRWGAPGSMRLGSAALGPGGVTVTLNTPSGSFGQLLRVSPRRAPRRLFSGFGRLGDVTYSPDGHWLLVTWRSADQFLFLSPRHPSRIVAISDIAAQFDPGTTAPPAFPRLAGWCCPVGATAP